MGILATALSLTGCTPEDETYLTKHDATVTFVTCAPVTATRIVVQRIPTSERDVKLIIDGVDQRGVEVRIVGEWKLAGFGDGDWHASAGGNLVVDEPCGKP